MLDLRWVLSHSPPLQTVLVFSFYKDLPLFSHKDKDLILAEDFSRLSLCFTSSLVSEWVRPLPAPYVRLFHETYTFMKHESYGEGGREILSLLLPYRLDRDDCDRRLV